jgi:hypothetical protein
LLRPCLPGRVPLAAALAAALCSGCASFVNEAAHPLRVETVTAAGEPDEGAQCTLTNDRGTQTMASGETTMVARSRSDLQIECLRPGQDAARGTLISRANVGLAGNLFFGGAIGAVIDHSKATAYTYPTWIRLVFGRTLVMDRREEVDGKPLLGRDPAPRSP